MPDMLRFISSILPVGKKHLVIFLIGLSFNIILYTTRLMYCLVVDNKAVKRIDHI